MRCPFLRDARVKQCQASAYRKMIVEGPRQDSSERCTTPAWSECPAAAPRLDGRHEGPRCPFLQESHVEYCGAAPVPKYVPASDALLSHCASDNHFYCEVFLAHADPAGTRLPKPAVAHVTQSPDDQAPLVGGFPVPLSLSYAPNHMWLDVSADGCCHVGIDAFLANLVGSVQRITFATSRTIDRPVAVLTVNGVDLQLTFPNALGAVAANYYLRTNPQKLTADPYGAGWLFEGNDPMWSTEFEGETVRAGLIPGHRAVEWIRSEAERLTSFAHEYASRPGPGGEQFIADGGVVTGGIAMHLDREDLINLFNDFFPTRSEWRRPW
jgi:glycine cleavage system H protein